MFADPQTVTYATVAKTLPATGRSSDTSEYQVRETDGTVYNLTLTHAFKARNRVVARLKRSSIVGDPLVTGQSILVSATATITIDAPQTGLSIADAQNLGKALVAWGTDANLLKLLNGET